MAGFLPISELSAYQTRWTIRARVTNKSPLRQFSRGGGDGKVFSVDLLDAHGGEIRASFFNGAVDKVMEKIQKGKCYTFSRGSVKVANRQFNMCNHRYELSFDRDVEMVEVEDDAKIEAVKFNFVDLRSVLTKTLPCNVDLCGIVTSFMPSYAFVSQAGKDLVKREIVIADDSTKSMNVTLWGERAKQDDKLFENNPVICLKGVVAKEWNGGRSGSLLEGGSLVFGSTADEAKRVQQWWTQGGSSQDITAMSQMGGGGGTPTGTAMDLEEMRRVSEKVTDKPEVYTSVCRLALVQMKKQGDVQPLTYNACQETTQGRSLPCNKRVDPSGYCNSCQRAGKITTKLNLRCRFADYGDSAWLTTFHEGAQKVIEMTAEEASSMEKNAGREALEAAIRDRYFNRPLQVTMRAKMDSFQGEARTNVTCIDARPVQHGEHGRKMLKEIQELLAAGVN